MLFYCLIYLKINILFKTDNHVDGMLKSTNDMLFENGLQNTQDSNGHVLQDKKGRQDFVFLCSIRSQL